MSRRYLPWILLLASTIQVVGIARTQLPAQDGLKFIRVAQEFRQRPWSDVVRGTDQHPLYSMGIAAMEPLTTMLVGPGWVSWRIAAQAVSSIAIVLMLIPLFGVTRRLFDAPTACLATLLGAALPSICEIGHDSLSDALALCLFTTTLWLGEAALRTGGLRVMLACGLVAGLGYWTRPEIVVLPLVIVGVASSRGFHRIVSRTSSRDAVPGSAWADSRWNRELVSMTRWVSMIGGFLAVVGCYAMVKGEVSEKLALRRGAAIVSKHDEARSFTHWLPPGLDDPSLDFSPKEEANRREAFTPMGSAVRVISAWAEGLGWVFGMLAVVGAFRVQPRSVMGRWLIVVYFAVFSAILVRHATSLGYLSGRHVLTLVVASLPWAAAGTRAVAARVASSMQWKESTSRRRAFVGLATFVATSLLVQWEPAHASRWGHRAAGEWLAGNANADDAVLDTRGWAAFVSGLRRYDYWHVRQALTDQRLAFVVVGADELRTSTPRAETLRVMLGHAAKPVASFPDRRDGSSPEVLVYRFTHPDSWEGLTR